MSIARDYRVALKTSHRNVRLFFLAAFLSEISGGVFSVLYNLYIIGLGLPVTVAGSYVSAGALAAALFLVPAGILSDRYGRRNAVLMAGALSVFLYLFQTFASSAGLITIASFLTGMVTSVIWVSVLPLLAENTKPEERLHLFSVNFGLMLVAQVIGSMGGGALADFFGIVGFSSITSIRITMLVATLLTLLSLLPFYKIEAPQQTETTELDSEKKNRADSNLLSRFDRLRPATLSRKFRERRPQYMIILKFTIASAVIGFGAGLVIPYLNLYFTDRFAVSKSGVGTIIAFAQMITAFTMFIGPETAKRLGAVRTVVTLQMLSIPFLLITAYSMNFWLVSGAVIIRHALMNSSAPIQDSIMMELVDNDLKGFAVSCGQTMFSLGWAVMGPISTHIVNTFGSYNGYATVFSITAGLYLIGSGFYYWSFGRVRLKTAANTSTA